MTFDGAGPFLRLCLSGGNGLSMDTAEEERLRQWLYQRHKLRVGAREARSPAIPDHLLPTIEPTLVETGPSRGAGFKCGHCGQIDTHFAMDGTCRKCPVKMR